MPFYFDPTYILIIIAYVITLWAQIKADVTGKELCTLEESETACLGSALLAAVGIGLYGSAAEAARAAVKIKGKYAPSGADYSAAYRRFCELDGVINT